VNLRDHIPIPLEEFNGLWARGDADSVPIDHFSDCENVQFIHSGFETRDGIDTYRAIGNVIRLYNYIMQSGQSLLILVEGGDIYHSYDETTLYGPILSIPAMDDFSMVAINGYAYITPITRSVTALGETREIGMAGEFVYVYKGDGTNARKAAGDPPTQDAQNPFLVAYNSSLIGGIDRGIHIVAFAYTDGIGGYSTAVGPFPLPLLYALGDQQAYITNVRDTTVPGITHKGIWMSKAIDPSVYVQADADTLTGIYELFFVKNIENGLGINSTIINAADVDLIAPFAAGILPNPTAGGINITNTDIEGFCDIGLHVIGVVYETDTGYLTAPGPEVMAVQTFVNENRAITVTNIPVSPDSFVTKRHLVASKAITNYNGNDIGYQLYFIPEGTLEDNTTTTLEVSFYDIDLLDDASHLLDNFAEIPAGVCLTTFNGRMVLTTTNTDISVTYLSFPGEPEAIDQVDGVVIIPLDGNPITTAQEFRDVLYVFKQVRTYALNDNGDVPSTWVPIAIDQGIGSSIHGVSQVLDSGGVNIDYLLIVDYSGLMMFNGAYQRPELSWKIGDYWRELDRSFFGYMQVANDSVNQRIYITLPNKRLLFADYQNGLNPKDIRWAKWRADIEFTSIALIGTDILIIGAQTEAS
jgi:hypothetical protein